MNVTEPRTAPCESDAIMLVRSGDLRQHRNRTTWPAQVRLEDRLEEAFAAVGADLCRAVPYDPDLGHGYIWSQRMGMDVFQEVDPHAPLVVAIAAWQYSHHLLAGLRDHRGPILTVANWSGEWPGLVGLLNLNACLTKMGVPYSTIWSERFRDDFFLEGLRQWLHEGRIAHDTSHVQPVQLSELPSEERSLGQRLGRQLLKKKAILGVFDEGCMGMVNAIIEDGLLNPAGLYKERLSQSALLAEMRAVADEDARAVRAWLEDRGVTFVTGSDPSESLTDAQIHEQCKMYVAAVRMADRFGCAAIGIQYQQGLKDMAPASDLAEGLLNNPDRPPVFRVEDGEELYVGKALPHFNEVDEGAAVDLIVNNRVWNRLGLDPSSTVHDVRWGEAFRDEKIDDFVWVFMISGAVPASHLDGGYAGARSVRQPPGGFPAGGGTLTGVCRPGPFVWSRVFIEDGALHADVGRGHVADLPKSEVERRWEATTPQWPIMNAVLHGVTRDQMMARHKANHVVVAYAPTIAEADRAIAVKAAMMAEMGIQVNCCGSSLVESIQGV